MLSENNYRERGYKAGADAYVVKPFEFSLLTLRIRNLIYNAWKAREAYKIDIDLSNVDITHSDSDEQWLKRAVALVFDRLSDPEFSVDDLCAGLNMSQSTLYRKLKVTAGRSPTSLSRTSASNTPAAAAARDLADRLRDHVRCRIFRLLLFQPRFPQMLWHLAQAMARTGSPRKGIIALS